MDCILRRGIEFIDWSSISLVDGQHQLESEGYEGGYVPVLPVSSASNSTQSSCLGKLLFYLKLFLSSCLCI